MDGGQSVLAIFFCQFPAVGGFYSILNGTSLFSDLFRVFVKHFAQSTGVKCPLDYVSIMPYVHVIFFSVNIVQRACRQCGAPGRSRYEVGGSLSV